MTQTAWLVQRAILAIVLMIGFYALALVPRRDHFRAPGPLLFEASELLDDPDYYVRSSWASLCDRLAISGPLLSPAARR